MKNLVDKINESKSSIEQEMELWKKRFNEPFGKALKELQWTINELGLYASEKNEYGFYTFTPFDNYVTAYALDGNKEYTFNHIKSICDEWDFTTSAKVKAILNKLRKLIK